MKNVSREERRPIRCRVRKCRRTVLVPSFLIDFEARPLQPTELTQLPALKTKRNRRRQVPSTEAISELVPSCSFDSSLPADNRGRRCDPKTPGEVKVQWRMKVFEPG
ncbi:hypothetical protein KM043_013168 [Ampulex compressa]|nr:hypothetical protein KM043_013168 [Ampulex compressa]